MIFYVNKLRPSLKVKSKNNYLSLNPTPTSSPTKYPTKLPTRFPTSNPTENPTTSPTNIYTMCDVRNGDKPSKSLCEKKSPYKENCKWHLVVNKSMIDHH